MEDYTRDREQPTWAVWRGQRFAVENLTHAEAVAEQAARGGYVCTMPPQGPEPPYWSSAWKPRLSPEELEELSPDLGRANERYDSRRGGYARRKRAKWGGA